VTDMSDRTHRST